MITKISAAITSKKWIEITKWALLVMFIINMFASDTHWMMADGMLLLLIDRKN